MDPVVVGAAAQVAEKTPAWVYLAITATIGVTVIAAGLIGLYTVKTAISPLSGGVMGLIKGPNSRGGLFTSFF